jgi:hypothetical protein
LQVSKKKKVRSGDWLQVNFIECMRQWRSYMYMWDAGVGDVCTGLFRNNYSSVMAKWMKEGRADR